MNYTKNLELQIRLLQDTLNHAKTIKKCDESLEAGVNVVYFRGVRAEAVPLFAQSMRDLIESSIEMGVVFMIPEFTVADFLENVNTITNDYRTKHNITT